MTTTDKEIAPPQTGSRWTNRKNKRVAEVVRSYQSRRFNARAIEYRYLDPVRSTPTAYTRPYTSTVVVTERRFLDNFEPGILP